MTSYLTLVLLYTDLTTETLPVTSREHANDIVRMEGDHVMDWYIKEDLKVE
jgi:hypothetical protein